MTAGEKGKWPLGQPPRNPAPSNEQAARKAVFEPHLPDQMGEEDDNESEVSSMVDPEDWIGEDDRASDSVPPSVMTEPEYQRNRLLMQQPPRSTIPI